MIKRLLAGAVLAMLLPLQGLAQSPSAFPVDIIAGPAPRPVTADGRSRFLHELHLTNFSPKPIELTGLDVLGRDGAGPWPVIAVRRWRSCWSRSGPPTPRARCGPSAEAAAW